MTIPASKGTPDVFAAFVAWACQEWDLALATAQEDKATLAGEVKAIFEHLPVVRNQMPVL